MCLNSEMNLDSAKIYLDSSKVGLNLRKRMIKLLFTDIDLLKFRQIFAEFKFISKFEYIYEIN